MFTASNIHYEASGRVRGITHGGIGAIHTLAQQLGLVEALDRRLQLLVIHLPYHESDHVLNIADNALCEGTCLEDIELRRNDANFLNALGARRIPETKRQLRPIAPIPSYEFDRVVEDVVNANPAIRGQALVELIMEAAVKQWVSGMGCC